MPSSTNISPLSLSEMIATRLCHDLAGPIGAVNNGVEFLEEDDPHMQQEARSLVASSAEQAIARLKFFRQCYGLIKATGEDPVSDIKAIVDDYFKRQTVSVSWSDATMARPPVTRDVGRIVLNAIYMVSDSLIRGGEITVHCDNNMWHIDGKGTAVRLTDTVQQLLENPQAIESLDPKTVQPYLMLQLIEARQGGYNMTVEDGHLALDIHVGG